jgi:hypothetical protein
MSGHIMHGVQAGTLVLYKEKDQKPSSIHSSPSFHIFMLTSTNISLMKNYQIKLQNSSQLYIF